MEDFHCNPSSQPCSNKDSREFQFALVELQTTLAAKQLISNTVFNLSAQVAMLKDTGKSSSSTMELLELFAKELRGIEKKEQNILSLFEAKYGKLSLSEK